MTKNKWFLNGGRESGRSFRLLCETYENKIAELEQKNETLSQNLDDAMSVENCLKKRNEVLEKENAELRAIAENQQSSNMERYFKNKDLEKENAELKEKLIKEITGVKID